MRSAKSGDVTLTVSNLLSILEFKEKYLEKLGDPNLKPDNLRMFCLGKELKDDQFLYSYDIIDEMTIQVMYKNLWGNSTTPTTISELNIAR